MSHPLPGILQFLGRLHVMLVHLPIGFLILLAVLEAFACLPKYKHVAAGNRVIVMLSAVITIVTAGCGWLLSLTDSYDANALFWHKWLGTALAPVVVLLALLHWKNFFTSYRLCLGVTMILLAVVGHFGGSLTHGPGYLFPWANKSQPLQSTPTYAELMEKPMYSAVVQPFFNDTCVSCHGPAKSKGGLRLDTAAYVFRGGEDGAVITPADSAHSEMIHRILAPADTDDHMPPQGKHQPSFNDIALLEWWIDSGASTNKTIAELHPPPNIVSILQSRGQSSSN